MSKTQKRKQPKNNAASKPSAASILLDTYLGEMSCIEPQRQLILSIKPVGNSN